MSCLKCCGEELGVCAALLPECGPESWRRQDLRDILCSPGTRGLRTPLLSFAEHTLCRAHFPPEKQVREIVSGKGVRKADVLVSVLMGRGENLHGAINTSAMWGTVQRQMLKFE